MDYFNKGSEATLICNNFISEKVSLIIQQQQQQQN